MRGTVSALAFIAVLVIAAVGFWFFRLRTQLMPVVVRNQTATELVMYVNGVPAQLVVGVGGCSAGASADRVASLKPGEEGWFCRTSVSGRTSRPCYEARSASGEVLAAVQWNGDDWMEHGSALDVQPGDPRRECHVTVGGS